MQPRNLSLESWHGVHANLVTLYHWARERDYSADNLEYMISKPWKYRTQFILAYCSETDFDRAKRIRLVQFS